MPKSFAKYLYSLSYSTKYLSSFPLSPFSGLAAGLYRHFITLFGRWERRVINNFVCVLQMFHKWTGLRWVLMTPGRLRCWAQTQICLPPPVLSHPSVNEWNRKSWGEDRKTDTPTHPQLLNDWEKDGLGGREGRIELCGWPHPSSVSSGFRKPPFNVHQMFFWYDHCIYIYKHFYPKQLYPRWSFSILCIEPVTLAWLALCSYEWIKK